MSLDPPLDILKVLARRVIDEQLFSATNVIRGPDPEEGEREPTKSGYIDYIGGIIVHRLPPYSTVQSSLAKSTRGTIGAYNSANTSYIPYTYYV